MVDNKVVYIEKNNGTLYINNSNEIDINEENSLISIFLDNFKVKDTLKLFFKLPILKNIKTTEQLFNVIILFIFLCLIFFETGILKTDNLSVVIILGALVLALIGELLSANFQLISKILVSEERTKSFLDNLSSMSREDVESGIRSRKFSVDNLNQFIEKIKDPNAYSPNIIEVVFDSQVLVQSNFNKLFQSEILKNINEGTIYKILIKYGDFLTNENMINCYESYKDNDKIIKMLIASCKYSDSLNKKYPDDDRLVKYYTNYQLKKQHIDMLIKITPLNFLKKLRGIITLILFFSLLPFFALSIMTQGATASYGNTSIDIAMKIMGALMTTLVATSIICALTVFPLYTRIRSFHLNRYEKNVLEKS